MPQPLGPVPQIAWGRNPSEHDIAIRWFAQLRNQYNAGGYLEHNDLTAIQGGTTDEYYHLTAAQSAAVANVGALGNNLVLYTNGSGVITAEAAFGYVETTNTLTVDNLTVADATILGSAAADTLTINSGTWTIGSNYIATRTAGTVAAGVVNLRQDIGLATGDAGGTSNIRGFLYAFNVEGGNAVSQGTTLLYSAFHTGSATLTILNGANASIGATSTGNVTNLRGFVGSMSLTNSGSVTTGTYFSALTPTLSSTGSINTLIGFNATNIGHATLITNALGFDCANFTGAVTLTAAYRSQMTSGTGKWGFYASGTADNAFAGNVRIGSVVAPTVALDVTGAALISTTLGVTGNTTLTGDLAINGGDVTSSATTFNFLAATVTTLNIGAAATTVSIGALTGTTTVNNDLAVGDQISAINGVTSSGNFGVPVVVASGRSAAQVAAVASVSTFTVGAADGSFEISANVNVTTSTVHDFTVTCAYTDEGNTARTFTFGFAQLAGATLLSNITNVTGAGPYESPHYHIRAKSGTAITIATTGTFTTVTYNVEGLVKQTN